MDLENIYKLSDDLKRRAEIVQLLTADYIRICREEDSTQDPVYKRDLYYRKFAKAAAIKTAEAELLADLQRIGAEAEAAAAVYKHFHPRE